jgi:ATP-dependent RNA helicase DDX46/PRP5
VIVFVDKQNICDELFHECLKHGYPCLSLHGGKDQADRDSTINDFKNGIMTLMIATSVAARGLDVKELVLVVNYDVPSHYEDYVHRCGRTGRAGRKGTAVTFIAPEEERHANDLVRTALFCLSSFVASKIFSGVQRRCGPSSRPTRRVRSRRSCRRWSIRTS